MKLKDIKTKHWIADVIVWLCYPVYNRFGIMLYPYRKYRDALQKRYANHYVMSKSLISY